MRPAPEPTTIGIHKRLLTAQKEIRHMKNAGYADYRLMEKMDERITILEKKILLVANAIEILARQFEDDGK